jgi:phosphohistidine phosphatase
MNRELWILRHGKAERYDGNEDYDRNLKKRGKRDATRMGEWLKEQGLFPDLVVSSPANRAIMTAKLVCDVLGIARKCIQPEKRLYDEGLVRVKSVLADCPSSFQRILLVGHNPELEDLLNFLVNPVDMPSVEKLLPTCGLARVVMPDEWVQLEQGCAELFSLTYPKALADESEDPFD